MPDAMSQVTGQAGHLLLLTALACHIARRFHSGRGPMSRVHWGIWCAAVAAALVPWTGVSGLAWMRGIFGDFSVTSMMLLGSFILDSPSLASRKFACVFSSQTRAAVFIGTALAGLLLYPMTLGLSLHDPYRLGYQPSALLVVLLPTVLFAWWTQRGVAFILLAAIIACNLSLLESSNLWDYLLDIWLVLYAWAWTLAALIRLLHRQIVPIRVSATLARSVSEGPPVQRAP